MKKRNSRRTLRAGVAVCLGLTFGLFASQADVGTNNLSATNAPAAEAAPQRDLAAARFLTTCAGCHSLGGAKLTGPELTPATAWPTDQLKTAIKKMEQKVGPLPDETIAELAELLKSADVRNRLKVEGEKIAAMFMAKMEPADPVKGRELFAGSLPLRNGGLACSACHSAAGKGGNLGPALNGIFTKTGGELPLISAIEQAKFKVMEPHYARHPVTKQEAMHLAKYFSTLNPQETTVPGPAFAPFGAACALAGLGGMVLLLKTQRASRRRDQRLERRRK